MSGYSKYPPSGPSRRSISLLIWVTLLLLLANLLHQGGIG